MCYSRRDKTAQKINRLVVFKVRPAYVYAGLLFCHFLFTRYTSTMLYTRKGDKGTTQLYGNNERFSKASLLPETLGVLDEFNSYVGFCKVTTPSDLYVPIDKKKVQVKKILHTIQENLFIIQAEVAGAKKSITKPKVVAVEKITDGIETLVPQIHSFSIAGGTPLSAQFDIARTLARKAERRIVAVHDSGQQNIGAHTLSYINRLSSLLFALVRFVNHSEHVRESAPTYK